MGTMQKIGRTATTVAANQEGQTVVTYHSTAVVTFDAATIVLNSNGWRGATTKARMNQASNVFNLGFQVWQVKRIWQVKYNGWVYDYGDGLILDRVTGKAYTSEEMRRADYPLPAMAQAAW